MKMKTAIKCAVGKPELKKKRGTVRRENEDNIKKDLKGSRT